MSTILAITYGLYFVLVGVRGNAPKLLTAITDEKQFLLWIIVMLVVAGLWETQKGAEVARPLAILIVMGFLLRNIATLKANAAALANSATLPTTAAGAAAGG